jgi:hypothetical protein
LKLDAACNGISRGFYMKIDLCFVDKNVVDPNINISDPYNFADSLNCRSAGEIALKASYGDPVISRNFQFSAIDGFVGHFDLSFLVILLAFHSDRYGTGS